MAPSKGRFCTWVADEGRLAGPEEPGVYMTAAGALRPEVGIGGLPSTPAMMLPPSPAVLSPADDGAPATALEPVVSIPSIDGRGFAFLGFGQISPLSLASAWRRSNSDFVGRPRFFLGGSTGAMDAMGIGTGCCCPFTLAKIGGRGWISLVDPGVGSPPGYWRLNRFEASGVGGVRASRDWKAC